MRHWTHWKIGDEVIFNMNNRLDLMYGETYTILETEDVWGNGSAINIKVDSRFREFTSSEHFIFKRSVEEIRDIKIKNILDA